MTYAKGAFVTVVPSFVFALRFLRRTGVQRLPLSTRSENSLECAARAQKARACSDQGAVIYGMEHRPWSGLCARDKGLERAQRACGVEWQGLGPHLSAASAQLIFLCPAQMSEPRAHGGDWACILVPKKLS